MEVLPLAVQTVWLHMCIIHNVMWLPGEFSTANDVIICNVTSVVYCNAKLHRNWLSLSLYNSYRRNFNFMASKDSDALFGRQWRQCHAHHIIIMCINTNLLYITIITWEHRASLVPRPILCFQWCLQHSRALPRGLVTRLTLCNSWNSRNVVIVLVQLA